MLTRTTFRKVLPVAPAGPSRTSPALGRQMGSQATWLLVAGLLLWVTAARAQGPYPVPGLPFWEWQVGQPTGYELKAFHAFNDSSIIAVGGHGTAVKTSNGGRSWQALPTGGTLELTSVSFADAQTGWIGSETLPATNLHHNAGPGRVLRTTNGGQSWAAQSIGDTRSVVNPRVVAVSPTEAYVIYERTGTSGSPNFFVLTPVPAIRRTTNGGLSWTVLPLPLTPDKTRVIDFAFPTAATGYVVVGGNFNELLRTSDHGQTWQRVEPTATNGGLAGFQPASVSFLDALNGWVVGRTPLGGAALFRTNDGGQSWALLNVPSTTDYYYGLCFADPLNGLMSVTGGDYLTADGGLTWSFTSLPPVLRFTRITRIRPSGAGWSVGPFGSLFATADFGQAWQSRSLMLPITRMLALAFPDPTHGWALPLYDDDPLITLRTTRRGEPWRRIDLDGKVPGVTAITARLNDGAFPDADTAWVAGYALDTVLSTFTGLVLRTTNAGRDWVRQPLDFGGPTLNSIAAWDTRRAVALSYGNELYVTRNGGQQWSAPLRPAPRRRLYRATWADSATVYVTTDSLVFLKSRDAGRSWQQLPLPLAGGFSLFPSQRMVFTSAQTGYFTTADGVWKTSNGGLSWSYANLSALGSHSGNNQYSPILRDLSFRTAREGWALGINDVLKTLDGGQTWSHVAYVGRLPGPVGAGPTGALIDRYNAFTGGGGIVRYSEKYVQVDTMLTRLAYCAGESLSLPFATTGSFAGEGNFLVQLSNAMGRFRPGQTRTVGSGTASPLAVTLPTDLAPGSRYRLRVIQRDSLVLGGDNGRDLLISAPAPAATLALLPAGTLQASLPAGAAAPARYEWERGGQPVAGQTGAQLTSPAAGSYRVRACTAACCGPWSAAVAVVPDLVVSSPQAVQGTYRNVTVTGPATGGAGTATLTGALTVLGTLTVQQGGTLRTACQPLSGAGSFVLEAGATLHVCDPTGISASGAAGAVRVDGARSFSPGASYVYDGTQAQATGPGLPGQVRNLTVANGGAGLTLTQGVALAQVLRLAAGNLTTNGHGLLLLSDATGTALIDNTGGLVIGTGTMQRFLDVQNPAGAGYRHYSAPVSNTTLADLVTTGYAPVLNSAYNTSAAPGLVTPFPTLFGYEQSRLGTAASNYPDFDKGWYTPAALSQPMPVGEGFTAYVSNGVLVDFTGTFTSGAVSRPGLARGPQAAGGWHLLGNPYPSPLDWSRIQPNERPGLDAAAYVFQSTGPYTGNYRAYVNGMGEPLVAAGSGFFVRTSTPGVAGAVNLGNAHRVTEFGPQPAFGRNTADTRPQLQLLVRGAGGADALTLYLESGATAGVDAEYDATKLANPTGLNLAALSGTQKLAIDGRPPLGATEVVVPLALDSPQAGAYRFEVANLAYFGAATVYLRDALTGMQLLLAPDTQYAFSLATATAGGGRFSLVLRPGGVLASAGALTAASVRLYPNPAAGSFRLALPALPGEARVQGALVNAIGQVVRRITVPLQAGGTEVEVDVRDLAAGVYALRLESSGQHYTRRVVLE